MSWDWRKQMKAVASKTLLHSRGSVCAIILFCVFALALFAAQAPAPAGPKAFATPDEAAQALVAACKDYDVATLMQILGPDASDLVSSQDAVADKNHGTEFATLAAEKHSVTPDPKDPNRATIVVGNEDWPFPIPLVKRNDKWYFDMKSGRQEVLYRRIGRNELDAIKICRGFVEAQQDYASEKHDGSEINQYAQRIISTPGKQDGLAWQNADGSWAGPIGEKIARAIEQGYSAGEPYHGYFFKILKGEGPAAPLGEMDFVVKGVMIGGFALVAAPAEYGVTGVKTFIVSHDGVVFEKDFGPKTLAEFQKMERFNPNKSWTQVLETDD